MQIDGDQAWVDAGGQRQAVMVPSLLDAVGIVKADAEEPVRLLNATAATPWEAVVTGLAALACGEEPAVVTLGR